MIHQPQTLHPRTPVCVTWISIALTAASLAVLIITWGYDSSPPIFIATCTAACLAWMWRMHLARITADERNREDIARGDDELIEKIRRMRPDNDARTREEEAFREITRHLNEGGTVHGLD